MPPPLIEDEDDDDENDENDENALGSADRSPGAALNPGSPARSPGAALNPGSAARSPSDAVNLVFPITEETAERCWCGCLSIIVPFQGGNPQRRICEDCRFPFLHMHCSDGKVINLEQLKDLKLLKRI